MTTGSASVKEAVGIALLVLASLLTLRAVGLWWSDAVVWPAILVASGVWMIWRQSTPRAAPTATATATPAAPGVRAAPLGELPAFGPRLVAGAALVGLGLVVMLQATAAIGTLRDLVVAGAIVVAGVTILFGTSWMGLVTALREERRERVLSEQRAEFAAHLHDSVLQTLALIQRRAEDPREVAALARRQERELRAWLAGEAPATETLVGALRLAAAAVEDAHGVRVEIVAVGDAALDERRRALAAAAAEAMTNAARHAGVATIDVFAEVDGDRVEVDVRDRGAGFDPAAVPPDRRGVRDSIIGRLDRHGGRATVRSAPGEGTEVELVLERP